MRARKAVSLKRLLAISDFISIHVPLTRETRHLLGAKEFALIKLGAIVINSARGGVIDQKALYRSLNRGSLAAPDPTLPTRAIAPHDPLLKLPNVVITPHIGSASYSSRYKMAQIATDNLSRRSMPGSRRFVQIPR